MILTTLVFAVMDAVSRHLAANYSVMTVTMIRYWVFAGFVLATAAASPGGIARVARSGAPRLQTLRGLLLAVEICVVVLSFVLLGLIGTHAIFAVYPLLVAALAGPVLGEYVGWRRGLAIIVGLIGVLVILRPGFQVFSPVALVPLAGALMFAVYALLTRRVAAVDRPETSLFYIGVVGAAAITLVAPFFWTPIRGWADWGWMLALCGLADPRAFPADQGLLGGRGRHGAALRLLSAGLRHDHRADRLRRAPRRLDRRRRGADPRRRPLHHPSRGPARAGALEGRWLGSLCGEPRFELAG